MIGKIITGKGFGGCIRYCLEDKKMKIDKGQTVMHNRAEVLHYNNCFGNRQKLVQQFNEVRRLNPRQSKPVLHITLSFAENEQLPGHRLCAIAEQCAEAFGFGNNQYLLVEHRDTDSHQHIHIVANRISYDGKTNVSDSNSYKRMADFCRKMEQQYHLQEVLNPRAFLSKEQRLIPRMDKRKQAMKEQLQSILKASTTMEQFCRQAKENRIEVIKSRGISFVDDKGVKVKGNEMNLSLQTIERQIQRNNLKLEQKETEYIKLNRRKHSLHL